MTEGEERVQRSENLCEKMMEKFPNLVKEMDIQAQEGHTESPKQDESKEALTNTHCN